MLCILSLTFMGGPLKQFIIAVIGGIAAIGGMESAFAEERCVGPTRKHHPLGEYDFTTNSRVEQDGEFSKYFACVENNSEDNWLRLSWFIPRITDRWVAPADFAEVFRLSTDAGARPIEGCIQYGNLGRKVVAQFLGDANDERRSANNTAEVECRKELGLDSAPAEDVVELPPNGISEESRIFVPSDLSDPLNSMLEVNFSYGVKQQAEGYDSFFAYSAKPYKGSTKANPEAVHLRSRFTPDAKVLYGAWSEATSNYIQLAKEGAFSFSVAGDNKWKIEPAFYDFVDKDGNILTSLTVPLFEPVAAQ